MLSLRQQSILQSCVSIEFFPKLNLISKAPREMGFKRFSSLSFCKANNHLLMSLVQISFFSPSYWLCWKWDSLVFIKKPMYTDTEIEGAGLAGPVSLPATGKQLNRSWRESESNWSPRKLLGRPRALLPIHTGPAEGHEEGDSSF